MKIQEYVDIREYNTLRIGGQFRYFVEVSDKSDLSKVCIFAKEKDLPIYIIGGGSNIVFPDRVFNYVVVKLELKGFEIVKDEENYSEIKVGSGENWDSFVERTVSMNLSGVEALSSIPGTCGATPVQNVGAYGQEVKDTISEVEVFDLVSQSFLNLTNQECQFSYRDSIFKSNPPSGGKGRYIIISVTFRLSKGLPKVPDYPGVKKYFDDKGITNPTLLEIREAIISIRSVKLPNPKEVANVGSFFKNPIVNKEIAHELKNKYPNILIFPISARQDLAEEDLAEDDMVKIPAGWLIENAGLKGCSFGPVSTYLQNALVLVNDGNATRLDINKAKNEIIDTVFKKFGIKLETEPEFV